MKKTLIKKEKAELQYNNNSNSIELVWTKMHDEETFKSIHLSGLTYIKIHKATGWLSDITKEGIVGPENTAWLQHDILPKFLRYGIRRIAFVMEPDVFKEYYVKSLKKALNSNSDDMIKYFDSVDDANNWLNELKEVDSFVDAFTDR